MPRDETDGGLPGQDSFLDIVANMVGILIILVMVVGVRASHVAHLPKGEWPGEDAIAADEGRETQAEASQLQAQIEAAREAALHEKREVEEMLARVVNISKEAVLAEHQRHELMTVQSVVEQDIERRRSQLSETKQAEFDVQRKITAAQLELDELMKRQLVLLDAPGEVEEIESVPTPLAKTVTGEEIHVRLKHGLLSVVPVDQLLLEVERRGLAYLRQGLRERNSAADVYGPINGFRMRLFLEVRSDGLAGAAPLAAAPRRTMAQKGEFLPVSEKMGQVVEQALMPNSPLMRTLGNRRSSRPALVVWAYPDSYDDLRTIKRAMWEMGVPMAIRPLEMGQRIVFSSHGTKSSAQ